MKVPQHLIDEATRRGIVEGATIVSAWPNYETKRHVVPPVDKWVYCETDLTFQTGPDGCEDVWINDLKKNTWCEVVQPAPSQGLEEGMATECSPAMRAAIVELASEIGLTIPHCTSRRDPEYPILLWHGDKLDTCHKTYQPRQDLAPEDFISKMRATAEKLPKRETINGHDVTFHKGSVYLPCSQYSNETVRAIAANLKD